MDLHLKSDTLLQGGKYRIIRVLGQGGFGITYLAEQTGLEMKVAIKEFFLKGSCLRDDTTSEVSVPVADNRDLVVRCLKKFRSEARKIASLHNDHIVNIIDFFDENGTSYYVMRYLGRGSLADKLKKGSLPEDTSLQIIREVADALDTVHKSGLLHLDVKPANILFDEQGRAVLIDFGVSKYVDSEQDTATTSSLVGFSRGFAPLEQINATGSSLTPASDIYSLGATLYNLVVGITPPDASSVMNNGLTQFPQSVSPVIQEAIVKSMMPSHKNRPQNISAFLDLLPDEVDVIQVDEPTVVRVESNKSSAPTKNKWYIYVSAAMLALSLFFAGYSFFKGSNKPMQDNTEELNKTITTLSSEKEGLQKQINELNNKINGLNSTNKTLREENTANKSEITRLKSDVNKYKTEAENNKRDAEKWRRSLQ